MTRARCGREARRRLGPDGRHATWWRNVAPPLEEALSAQPGATFVAAPPFRRPSLRPARPAWLAAIRVVRRADSVFWLQLQLRPPGPVWALAYVQPFAHRSLYALDTFPSVFADIPRYVNAQRIALCFLAYRISALHLATENPGRRYEWLPFGFNSKVFFDHGLERDVYAFWMGRRHAPFHEALIRHCQSRGLEYRFFEPPGLRIPLDELSTLAARSRYFVSIPTDIQDPIRTGGVSIMGPRYLEGLGAGCLLLGALPGSGEFERLLSKDAIVECAPDGSDLSAMLDAADARADLDGAAAKLCQEVHREHTWENRARHVYERLLTVDESA